jgi:plastocyanin
LVSGLVALVGLSAIVARVTTAQVNSNDRNVAMVDNCDPTTFNAAIGPGTCAATPHEHDTTFAEFIGLLFSPLAANVIGHPAWNFAPGYISIRAGQTVRAINAGGESHTFTEVTAFGGGVVPALNGVGGPAGTLPLVPAAECSSSTMVPFGETVRVTGLAPGVHKFQCCIHPWMRAVVDVEN